MPALAHISELVKEAAVEADFDLVGIAAAGDFAELEYFPGWLREGRGGEMQYLQARNDAGELKRASLHNALPWARSVIVCALNYNTAEPYSTEAHDPTRGWISRYAWSQRDYHDVLLEQLQKVEARLRDTFGQDFTSRSYVDTGPIIERVFAKYASIGWIGKNTCIINQHIGSWLFLGVIVTSLELEPDIPAPDRCGSCTRCLDACPTQAFIGPYQLDASRCISYLTIEKRGTIPEDLREGMGRHLFGCDICQDVCPWNRRAPATSAPEFQAREELVNPPLKWLAEMNQEEFRDVFRGSPLKRTKFSGLRRNAAIVMGNSGDRKFIPALEKLAGDPDEVVAEHARWALERLKDFGANRESEAEVRGSS